MSLSYRNLQKLKSWGDQLSRTNRVWTKSDANLYVKVCEEMRRVNTERCRKNRLKKEVSEVFLMGFISSNK